MKNSYEPTTYEEKESEYLHVYKYSSDRALLNILVYGGLSILLSFGSYYCFSDGSSGYGLVFSVFTLIFIFVTWGYIRKLFDNSPKLKLSNRGFWTKKSGFIDWNDIENQIDLNTIRRNGIVTSMTLTIHLKKLADSENKETAIVIDLEDLEDRDKIVSRIDYLRITRNSEVEDTSIDSGSVLPQQNNLNNSFEHRNNPVIEPSEYLYEFYNSVEQSKKIILLGIPLLIIATYFTYYSMVSDDFDSRLGGIGFGLAIAGILFTFLGFRDFFDKSAKLKLSTEGFWTEKAGFIAWQEVIDLVINKGNYNTVVLKVYLRKKDDNTQELPVVAIGITGLKDADKIVPLIEALRLFPAST